MSATETIIGDGGTGCVEPVSGGVDTVEVIAREGFGGLKANTTV